MEQEDVLQRIEARLSRVEAALERVTTLLDEVAPNIAMAADIADEWVKERVGGEAVEARMRAAEDAILRLTEPETLSALVRLAEMAPRLERVAGLAASFDDHVAMASDIADEWIAEEVGGAAVEDRLSAGKEALIALSEPSVLSALTRLAELAPRLETAAGLAASFDDHFAMASDIADEWIREEVGGEAVEARLAAGKEALVRLSDPKVLSALMRLAEQAPKLESVASLTASFDDNFAMVSDIADEWIRDNLGGAGMEQLVEHVRSMLNPEVATAYGEVVQLAPRLLRTAHVAADLDDFVGAMADALREPAEPVGMFGLFSAMRDPEIQRGVGRALHVTRHLGRHDNLLPIKRWKPGLSTMSHHEVLIIGGGAAGITLASLLTKDGDCSDVAIIEPADVHYYQPLFTLVGGGVFEKGETFKKMADLIPPGVEWIRAAAATFDPENNSVTLASGQTVTYDILAVCAGIKLDWDRVAGLKDAVGKDGVCSNYSPDTVSYTWPTIQAMKKGRAIFTYPQNPIKCAGAPQKIMWLAEHHFERTGVRDDIEIVYATSGGAIFGIPRYAKTLARLADERDVHMKYFHTLKAIDAANKKATFAVQDGEDVTMDYDMIHVTPPQCAPDFIKNSPIANAEGWVDVDMYTTQHNKFPNIFSIGDASSLPNSKTAAAVRKQAPVAAQNILAFRKNKPMPKKYNGYASCPLVTGYGRLILAEFGYGGEIMETMPFDQSQERYSMYFAKAPMMPKMYWHGMLKGRW